MLATDPADHSYNADPGVDDQDSVVLEVHRHHVLRWCGERRKS